MICVLYTVSATSSYHTETFGDGWEYDLTHVAAPTLMVAGTGSFDAGTAGSKEVESNEGEGVMQGITPLWSLEENFAALSDDIDKAYGRKTGVDHGDSYLQWDPYMTAWFRYHLQGDEYAGTAFYGDAPELSRNPSYQDVTISCETH